MADALPLVMSSRGPGALIVAVAAVAAAGADRRAATAQQAAPFRSGVDVVALTVTVTDRQQRPMADLSAADFFVLEDGVPQEIAYFARDRLPVDLGVLLDTSSSMRSSLTAVQRAAEGFVRALKPGDRVSVVRVHERADILHPLSADLDGAVRAIHATRAHGATALFNAIYVAVSGMAAVPLDDRPRRRALAVLSDGQDTASIVQHEDALAISRESGVAVYTIVLGPAPPAAAALMRSGQPVLEPQYVMRSFARETGARCYVAADATQLGDIYASITAELASQYTIGYVSSNGRRDGRFRSVSVSVPSRPNAEARTRSGYSAPRSRPHR